MSSSLFTTHIRNGSVYDSIHELRFGTKSPLEQKLRNKKMFVLGMGFVGQFFGQQLKNRGWDVSGTCTSIVKKKKLESRGFDIYHFDANEPEWRVLDVLKSHTHILVSIPPLEGIGDPMLNHEELLKSGLLDGSLRWLGYLSTTSVYGNCAGQWVDEDYPTNPSSESAKLRLASEKRWLKMGCEIGVPTHVFRLGGIYGPGRSAVDTILKQEALTEGQRRRRSRLYTSRIHVEDICQALEASFYSPTTRKIFNIVDDDPAPREEVFEFAYKMIEKKWPGHIKRSLNQDHSLTEAAKEYLPAEKRVLNGLMKNELGVKLIHSSYRTGLQSIIDQIQNNPFKNSFLDLC